MSIGKRIAARRKEMKLTQPELGTLCGTTKQTIFKYENEIVTNIPLDRLEKIALALDVTPAYLMGWENSENLPDNILPMPETYSVPRVGAIACGTPILAEENIETYDQIPAFVQCDFTLLCKGDSMVNARIYDGDIVCIRQQPEVENGEIAAVLVGEEATLKRVRFQEGAVVLWPENPAYAPQVFAGEDMEKVKILGKATHFISTVR